MRWSGAGFCLLAAPSRYMLRMESAQKVVLSTSADQRSRTSGSIPALTGMVARSIVPDRGGGNSVTELNIQLGTIPLSGSQRAFGVFYKFSTKEIPRANGFSLTTGISTLSCQVSGMNLDYSGPPRSYSAEAAR